MFTGGTVWILTHGRMLRRVSFENCHAELAGLSNILQRGLGLCSDEVLLVSVGEFGIKTHQASYTSFSFGAVFLFLPGALYTSTGKWYVFVEFHWADAGTLSDSQIAELRHIKLLRQAAKGSLPVSERSQVAAIN